MRKCSLETSRVSEREPKKSAPPTIRRSAGRGGGGVSRNRSDQPLLVVPSSPPLALHANPVVSLLGGGSELVPWNGCTEQHIAAYSSIEDIRYCSLSSSENATGCPYRVLWGEVPVSSICVARALDLYFPKRAPGKAETELVSIPLFSSTLCSGAPTSGGRGSVRGVVRGSLKHDWPVLQFTPYI